MFIKVEPTIASIEEEILEVSQNCQLDKILMEPPRQFVEPHLESDLGELTEGPCEERIDDSQSEYLDQLQVQNSQIIHNPKLQVRVFIIKIACFYKTEINLESKFISVKKV